MEEGITYYYVRRFHSTFDAVVHKAAKYAA